MNKNHTHEKKVDHTSEFPSDIYWWTLKNLKNQKFVEMKKKKTPGDLIISQVDQKPQSHEVQFLRYRVRQIFFGHFGSFWVIFCPFTPHPSSNTENQNSEKRENSIWRCHHFKFVQQKTWSYDVWLLRYGVQQTYFLYFRQFFALLLHYWSQKLKCGKM